MAGAEAFNHEHVRQAGAHRRSGRPGGGRRLRIPLRRDGFRKSRVHAVADPDGDAVSEAAILTGANVGQILDPGTYRVAGTFALPFTFTIESNWILEHLGSDTVSLDRSEDPGADWLDIQLIENVMSDPCAGELSEPAVPKNPEDLIGALASMTGFVAGTVSEVTVGDHAGSHVFVTNEMDGDALGCVGGNGMPIYTTVDLPEAMITNGNSRDEFWVVDVDGTPVVLHGLLTRSSDEAADVLETQQIVETITFD